MHSSIKKDIANLPASPGIYIFKNQRGNPLYIGKAANIRKRVRQHFEGGDKHLPLKKKLLEEVVRVTPKETQGEIEALVLEMQLIKTFKPRYNIVLRDDKQYFYVGFTGEEFSKVFLTHQPVQDLRLKNPHDLRIPKSKIVNHKSYYIGPFTDGKSLKATLRRLRQLFPYCSCKTPHRAPCLNYHMGIDPGYCCAKSNKQSTTYNLRQAHREYRNNIGRIKRILGGQGKKVLSTLKADMKQAAQKQQFEKAEKYKKQWEGLSYILSHKTLLASQRKTAAHGYDPVIPKMVNRIEGYDISNIQGNFAVGSMVVFVKNNQGAFKPEKSAYRKFKIKSIHGANDPAMVGEVLARRLNHPEWTLPQLILIDGGKTQRNAARNALAKRGISIPIYSLAKRVEELYTEKGMAPLSTYNTPTQDIFKHIRNEAHRFAISYYRKLHQKNYRD